VLIESLSGYEAYSTAIDHLSESDEDLYSEQKIEIPTSMPGSERTLSEQEQSEQREDEERRSEDDRSTSKLDVQSANENIQSSGLGPYKSPAQMPYPTESFDSQILPPHSPPVDKLLLEALPNQPASKQYHHRPEMTRAHHWRVSSRRKAILWPNQSCQSRDSPPPKCKDSSTRPLRSSPFILARSVLLSTIMPIYPPT